MEARFRGHDIIQILASKKMFYWPGQDRVSVRTPDGVLYWRNCLDLMEKFVKDEGLQEMPAKEYTKRKDPFMRLKTGPWGPTMDLSVGKQVVAAARIVGAEGKGKEKDTAPLQAQKKVM